jgi:hypothetical protein
MVSTLMALPFAVSVRSREKLAMAARGARRAKYPEGESFRMGDSTHAA